MGCGARAICREGYDCAEGFLEHLQNVDGPLKAAMDVADVVRVEVHGPVPEVDKLREPLKNFPAVFWSYPNDTFFIPAEYATSQQASQPDVWSQQAAQPHRSSTPQPHRSTPEAPVQEVPAIRGRAAGSV